MTGRTSPVDSPGEQRTHLAISASLVGGVVEITEDGATVRLTATPEMAADARGLVHGGFTFGLADYAAMCAVNDPNVVLGEANVRFLAPVVVGQEMTAHATVTATAGKRRTVEVVVRVAGSEVLKGNLACFILDTHILDRRAPS